MTDPRDAYVEEQTFRCQVTTTMSKLTDISTSDYTCESGVDEDGVLWNDYGFHNVCWDKEFIRQHMSIHELLELLHEYLRKDIEETTDENRRKHLAYMIRECDDWVEDDMEVDTI